MKQLTQQSTTVEAVRSKPEKTVTQQEASRKDVVTDSGETDMDICSISSEEGRNVDIRDTNETGKGVGSSEGSVGSSEGSVASGIATASGDCVENTSTGVMASANVQVSEAPSNEPMQPLSAGKHVIVHNRDVQTHASVEVTVPIVAVQQPIGRSVSAPGARAVAKQSSVAPPPVKAVKKSPTTNQTSVGVALSLASKATGSIVQSLKKSLSHPTSHSGSKSNSPALSPTHSYVPSPSGSIESGGGEGLPSDRTRQRSGSCVKVPTYVVIIYRLETATQSLACQLIHGERQVYSGTSPFADTA